MSRRRRPIRREILPDPVFADTLVTKFVNCMMIDGKKSASEKIFYGALEIVTKKAAGEDPLQMFKRALENLKPQVEVKSRRVGGSNYQVPVEVRPERRQALAIRWLIGYSRLRNEKSMVDKLAAESFCSLPLLIRKSSHSSKQRLVPGAVFFCPHRSSLIQPRHM
jgi:small subunit ribosomal protein S7